MKTVPNQKIRCYFKANLLKGGIFVENTETGNAAAKETKEKKNTNDKKTTAVAS